MLPVISGADATVRQILLYTLALAGTVMLPYLLGFSGMLYGVGAGVASAIFVGLSLLLRWVRVSGAIALQEWCLPILFLSFHRFRAVAG